MSHMKLSKEPHAAREPRVGHPCSIWWQTDELRRSLEAFRRNLDHN